MDSLINLKKMALDYGIELSEFESQQLERHLDLVLEKNKVINLTSIKDKSEALVLHVLDSLLLLPYLRRMEANESLDGNHNEHEINCSKSSTSSSRHISEGCHFLDMGTGAGFPGIPLILCSHSTALLVDSVGKKVTCCNEFISQLCIQDRASAVHDRLETLALSEDSRFDLVVARALAPLDVLIEYGTPFLRFGGYLLFTKARPSTIELQNANRVSQICGVERVSRETFELPYDFGHREILLYKRVKASKLTLPRRNGEARSKPLATLHFM